MEKSFASCILSFFLLNSNQTFITTRLSTNQTTTYSPCTLFLVFISLQILDINLFAQKSNKLKVNYHSYPKSRKIEAIEEKKCNVTALDAEFPHTGAEYSLYRSSGQTWRSKEPALAIRGPRI